MVSEETISQRRGIWYTVIQCKKIEFDAKNQLFVKIPLFVSQQRPLAAATAYKLDPDKEGST